MGGSDKYSWDRFLDSWDRFGDWLIPRLGYIGLLFIILPIVWAFALAISTETALYFHEMMYCNTDIFKYIDEYGDARDKIRSVIFYVSLVPVLWVMYGGIVEIFGRKGH